MFYWISTVVLINAVFLLEFYINWRQLRKSKESKIKKEYEKIASEEEFLRSQTYTHDKIAFSMVKETCELVMSNAMFYFLIWTVFWNASAKIMARFSIDSSAKIIQSLVYLVLNMALDKVTSIPFSLYWFFVVEEKHGFNKMTLGLFFKDLVKETTVSTIFGAIFFSIFNWILDHTGPRFYLFLAGFFILFQIVMILIYPTFIMPLFNEFKSIDEGELKDKIEALARRIGFPLSKIYVMDGSKRSSHSNAFFFGLFNNKRIVIYDTLLKQCSVDEIVAVVGHELGHWKHSHIYTSMLLTNAHVFCILYAFSFVINSHGLYADFGFVSEQPKIIGLKVFLTLLTPFNVLFGLAMNALSRKNEFQADKFSCGLGFGENLKNSLIQLQLKNKGCMNPDGWYSTYHYSHPTLLERISAIEKNE